MKDYLCVLQCTRLGEQSQAEFLTGDRAGVD
jgi:hypothetical protein